MGLKDTFALIILGIFVIIYSTLLYYTLKELPINENEEINTIWVLLRKLLQRTFFGTFDFVSDLVVIVNVIFYNPILFYVSLGFLVINTGWYYSTLYIKGEPMYWYILAPHSSLFFEDANNLGKLFWNGMMMFPYIFANLILIIPLHSLGWFLF